MALLCSKTILTQLKSTENKVEPCMKYIREEAVHL